MKLLDWQYMMLHHSTTSDGQTLDKQGIVRYHESYRVDFRIVSKEEFYERLRKHNLGHEGYGKVFQRPWLDSPKNGGYHFYYEQVKKIWEVIIGRPLTIHGAHCREQRMNYRAIGICCIGNFDNMDPDPEMLQILVSRLIVPLSLQFNIPPCDIIGHRDIATYKSCPGTKFDIEKIRQMVKDYIKKGY